MHQSLTTFVRFIVSFALTICLSVSGCATVRSPISLTQWGWGRSVDLSRNKPPEFDRRDSDDAVDVTEDESKPERKEPRRLFGLGTDRPKDETPSSKPQDKPKDSRWWSSATPKNGRSGKAQDPAERQLQERQFAKAEKAFNAGELDEAARLLKPLTKKKNENFWSKLWLSNFEADLRQDHNRVREDSLFLLAETYHKQEKYSKAKDNYEALLKDYPSTRHLNTSTKRMFDIARTWLGMPKFATTSEITTVNLEDPQSTPTPKREKPPHSAILVPNLFDKTRPAFDTPGHALEALKAIWLYDPRGPLADDAIMLTASHHLRTGNYQDADRYFSMLREEYPQSTHLQTSFVLGSHVKLMSYQGAGYDEKQLEDARLLKESTLRLFPNLPEKERLKDELAKIEEARAQRLWDLVELYGRKSKPKSQIIYAEELVQNFPKSKYAPKAREVLARLKPSAVPVAVRKSGEEGFFKRAFRRSPEQSSADEQDNTGSARMNSSDEASE